MFTIQELEERNNALQDAAVGIFMNEYNLGTPLNLSPYEIAGIPESIDNPFQSLFDLRRISRGREIAIEKIRSNLL